VKAAIAGASIAVLEGGIWFGEGDVLLAWQNQTLSTATVLANNTVAFGPAVDAPFPQTWSLNRSSLGVAGADGGAATPRPASTPRTLPVPIFAATHPRLLSG